jgi:hypothetical protein
MDRLENNAIPARYFSIDAFVSAAFQRFHQPPKRVFGKFVDVVQNARAPVRRNRVKLFCGAVVNLYVPKS